jgi:hypothetical protein
MLPNTQKITSEIALMPDMALKQMAMMHKNDPYVLPLIVSEDSRRKEMRRAAQARMAGAMPPKVNDAAVAQVGSMPNVDIMGNATGYAHGGSVLPENHGIGALHAPNLSHMADGGIAGYATVGNDGNSAPNPASGPAGQLAFNNEPVMRMAGGGIAHFRKGGGLDDYADYIRETATKYGMDPDMAMRLFKTESGGDPYAESKKGAVGLGQLLPGTAKEMGLSPSERTDPHKNINASIGYFMKQMGKYKDPAKAAAAYNWGSGNLDKHLSENKGELNPVGLPKETANYLTKLMPGSVANAGELPKNEWEDNSQKVSGLPSLAQPQAQNIGYTPEGVEAIGQRLDQAREELRNMRGHGFIQQRKDPNAAVNYQNAQNLVSNLQRTYEEGMAAAHPELTKAAMIGNPANPQGGLRVLPAPAQYSQEVAKEVARPDIARQLGVATPNYSAMTEEADRNAAAPVPLQDDDMSPNGEIKQGIPEKAKESFMDAAKEALSPKKTKGLSDDDLTAFGLGLMASKNPNLFGAAGEAGLGALAMKREQQKTEREDLYRQALAREANAKAATYESGSSTTNQALAQADKLYDNWLKSLNKIDAMQLTPEMQKQKQEEFLLKSFQMFKIAPPAGIGTGAVDTATQLDPLGLRKR